MVILETGQLLSIYLDIKAIIGVIFVYIVSMII